MAKQFDIREDLQGTMTAGMTGFYIAGVGGAALLAGGYYWYTHRKAKCPTDAELKAILFDIDNSKLKPNDAIVLAGRLEHDGCKAQAQAVRAAANLKLGGGKPGPLDAPMMVSVCDTALLKLPDGARVRFDGVALPSLREMGQRLKTSKNPADYKALADILGDPVYKGEYAAAIKCLRDAEYALNLAGGTGPAAAPPAYLPPSYIPDPTYAPPPPAETSAPWLPSKKDFAGADFSCSVPKSQIDKIVADVGSGVISPSDAYWAISKDLDKKGCIADGDTVRRAAQAKDPTTWLNPPPASGTPLYAKPFGVSVSAGFEDDNTSGGVPPWLGGNAKPGCSVCPIKTSTAAFASEGQMDNLVSNRRPPWMGRVG